MFLEVLYGVSQENSDCFERQGRSGKVNGGMSDRTVLQGARPQGRIPGHRPVRTLDSQDAQSA